MNIHRAFFEFGFHLTEKNEMEFYIGSHWAPSGIPREKESGGKGYTPVQNSPDRRVVWKFCSNQISRRNGEGGSETSSRNLF